MDDSRSTRRARTAGVLGVMTGVVLVVGLAVGGVLDRPTPPLEGAEAAEALVDAWGRYRSATVVIESEWRRTSSLTGSTLQSGRLVAQAPPDRIVRQMGAIRGRMDGGPVRCSTGPFGEYRCFRSEHVVAPYADEVASELDALRGYFDPQGPLYRVTGDRTGCFDLLQIAPYPDPPYGREARLCFDPVSGALRYVRRDFGEVVEEVEALVIRTEVRPGDFSLEEDSTFAPRGDVPDMEEELRREVEERSSS